MKKKSVAELKPYMPDAFNNNFSLEVAFKEGYNFAVSQMGREGGLAKSDKKSKAVRANGKKGGRPKSMPNNGGNTV